MPAHNSVLGYIFGGSTADKAAEAAESVDLVYRYVNPTALSQSMLHANGLQRYRDNDELRFSMRSFAALEGIRRIFVVACGPPPTWLDVSHPLVLWCNETSLLDQLRVEREITRPLNIGNSEPAKLAIALLPGLGSRFLLVDDDFFIVPQVSQPTKLSARTLFFDEHGLPLLPIELHNAHRPIPFLRDAYAAAVRHTPTAVVQRILTSGGQSGRSASDQFPTWGAHMLEKGTAQSVDMIRVAKCDFLFCHNHFWLGQDNYRRRVSFALYRPEMRNDSFISRAQAKRFFDELMRERPVLANINDDWPPDDGYASAIAPFKAWMLSTYPKASPWEKEAATVGRAAGRGSRGPLPDLAPIRNTSETETGLLDIRMP